MLHYMKMKRLTQFAWVTPASPHPEGLPISICGARPPADPNRHKFSFFPNRNHFS